MKCLKIILGMFLLYLAGCAASSNNPPLWMADKNQVYSQDKYLSALGSGDTYEDAKRVANGNLAQIFGSNISTSSSTVQKYTEILKAEGVIETEDTKSEKSVQVSSVQSLINIKFGKKYVDDKGVTHTLAYIDRHETAKIYEEKISANEDNLEYFLDKAEESEDKILKFGYYKGAAAFALLNRDLIDQLRIISPKDAETSVVIHSYAEMSAKVREIGNSITYGVEIEGDNNDMVKGITETIFSNLGFNGSAKPFLAVKGKVSFEKVDLSKTTKFYKWEINLKINRTDNGNTIFSIDKVSRDGALSYERAKQVSYYKIREYLGTEIQTKLNTYFDSGL